MNLYPYQWEGVRFLQTHRCAYLADEMGLGKTAQAITAARFEVPDDGDILVVAPASTLPNWRAEFAQWWPGRRAYFVSYSRLIGESWKARVSANQWSLVILDEAHYCKTVSAQRTRAALQVARGAARAWLLSGTPMPNDPVELWAPVKYLWPEIAKRRGITRKDQWRDHFTKYTVTRYGPRVYATRHAQQLKDDLATFMLRRRMRDVLPDLPPLRVDLHRFPKDGGWDEIAAELKELLVDVGEIEGLDWVPRVEPEHLATVRRMLGAYKAPRVAEVLADELERNEYEKIVVLGYHRATLDVLRRSLSDFGVVGFDGSSSESDRARAITSFSGKPRVFVAQQSAAGVGINLQSAHEIVLVEPAWSPSDNWQAIKRVHRIGQENPCRARMFAVSGSLDEAVLSRLAQKTQMLEEVGL